MQEENFSYTETKQICGPCINNEGDNDCLFLQYTESARAMIHSYTKEVELAVGKISIQHAELSKCYDTALSKFLIDKNRVKLRLAKTGDCDKLL